MEAPVIIFAYNRADKLKACIDSLSGADGHENSEVFVYADGSKGGNDRSDVERVRTFLDEFSQKSIFRSFKTIRRDRNTGLAANVISGVTEIIHEYGKAIVLEDDLEVSKDFITYMNAALDYYEDDPKIWSVTGFSEPLKALRGYKHDVYMGYRGCSTGWGTWKDRWDTVDWEMKRYKEVLSDPILRKRFERGGRDLTRILKDQKAGIVDSWAIRWCLEQSLQDKYTVYPVSSFIRNTGIDGSGTHQPISKHANDNPHTYGKEIKFERLGPEPDISREYCRVHSNIAVRVLRNLNRAGIKKQIKRFLNDRQ